MAISRSPGGAHIPEIASENHCTSLPDFHRNDNHEDGFIQQAFLVYEGKFRLSWVMVRPKYLTHFFLNNFGYSKRIVPCILVVLLLFESNETIEVPVIKIC